eukprot:TRINITY_DN56788_c0_g1_i1.p1 TRINITY_DN56788_c0_g1~~TRINITY_DN56788_c0_g1_i1.p1  ORF type:complete len:554 (-),score=121.01 TRINITY_DN56788_c0_g1_i1:67-1728(-)
MGLPGVEEPPAFLHSYVGFHIPSSATAMLRRQRVRRLLPLLALLCFDAPDVVPGARRGKEAEMAFLSRLRAQVPGGPPNGQNGTDPSGILIEEGFPAVLAQTGRNGSAPRGNGSNASGLQYMSPGGTPLGHRPLPQFPPAQTLSEFLFALGSGSGFQNNQRLLGDNITSKEFRNIHYQHLVATGMILMVFFGFLSTSVSMVYWRMRRRVQENSSVTYFSDGGGHPANDALLCESRRLDDFINAFDGPPSEPQLLIIGVRVPSQRAAQEARVSQNNGLLQDDFTATFYDPFYPLANASEEQIVSAIMAGEEVYGASVAFSFALDLSPWLRSAGGSSRAAQLQISVDPPRQLWRRNSDAASDGSFGQGGSGLGEDDQSNASGAAEEQDTSTAASDARERRVGMSDEDLSKVEAFLAQDSNDLACVEICKEIIWEDWEELSLNIRACLRQRGFNGAVRIFLKGNESIEVFKNKTWAHFMRSQVTRVLAALSLVGWLFYEVYVKLRTSRLVVKSVHRVEVPLSTYWDLVGSKLTANGFIPDEDRPRAADSATRPSRS